MIRPSGMEPRSARKTGKPHCSEEQGLRRLVRKRCVYRLDWGHGPIQEYAQHVRVGVTLSTTGPQASGITLDGAWGSFLESTGHASCKLAARQVRHQAGGICQELSHFGPFRWFHRHVWRAGSWSVRQPREVPTDFRRCVDVVGRASGHWL